METPNYRQYRLSELEEALRSIDRDAYPERARTLEDELARRVAIQSGSESPSSEPDDGDQKTALGCFGGCLILMGTLTALSGVSTFLLGMLSDISEIDQPVPMLPLFMLYLPIGIILIWLGIGSILARRWARALVLVISVMWLGVGILGLFYILLLQPWTLVPGLSSTTGMIVMGFAILIFLVLLIGVPLTFALFYQRTDVRATCERRDPHTRWTDKCPLPVLGLSIWLMWGMSGFVWYIAYRTPFPLFGIFVTGVPGLLLILSLSALYGIVAWRTYKLDIRAWTAALTLTVVLSASHAVTFSVRDMEEFFAQSGFSAPEISDMQSTGMLSGWKYVLSTSATSFLMVGYLVFVRRYFRQFSKQTDLPG